MKKTIGYWLFFFLYISSAWGQISYERRKENNNGYSELLQRFIDSDSTLISQDFHDLYYGAVFLPHYQPDNIMDAERQIRLANYDRAFFRAYNLSDSLLRLYPFSIQAFFEKAYACYNLKRFEEEKYNTKRYKVLINTILSSGDGKSMETAYHTNLSNDEYEVLKFLGIESTGSTEIEIQGNSYRIFSLKRNKLKMKDIYFNITRQVN